MSPETWIILATLVVAVVAYSVKRARHRRRTGRFQASVPSTSLLGLPVTASVHMQRDELLVIDESSPAGPRLVAHPDTLERLREAARKDYR
jgi:hypothetical protein